MELKLAFFSKDHSLIGLSYHRGKARITRNNQEKEVTFHEVGIGFMLFHIYVTFY